MSSACFRIPGKIAGQFNKIRQNGRYLCHAPFTSMSVGLDGLVSPCCYTQIPDDYTGSVFFPESSLSDIWNGSVFEKYRKLVKKRKLPYSCNLCREKLMREDFHTVKIREYDHYMVEKDYPALIELAVDNTCNLECVMCSSLHSSKIAVRQGVKPGKRLDLELLFEQLKEFLPHVREMIFTGGEPFLSKFYQKLWAELISVNPNCKITLNTNASFLNDELKGLLERGRFNFNVSIDSVVKETYEMIRVNAVFETVMENFRYLCDYSARKNVLLSVPVCPLVINYKEIPQIIGFCNKNNAYMVFVHVFGASNSALNAASVEVLSEALAYYRDIKLPDLTAVEKHNALCFKGLVEDVSTWREQAVNTEEYIKAFKADLPAFSKASREYQEQLLANAHDEAEGEIVCAKMNRVFNALPEYFKTAGFVKTLSNVPVKTVIPLLKDFPETEIEEYFRMIFRQMISQ